MTSHITNLALKSQKLEVLATVNGRRPYQIQLLSSGLHDPGPVKKEH